MRQLQRLACLAACALPLAAGAAPVTYDFHVTATSGPLSGVTSDGSFTFDSSIIPVGGGLLSGVGNLLSALSFVWNGVAYDETTANTFGFNGGLSFDAAGALTSVTIGTGTCGAVCTQGNLNTWYIFGGSGGIFSYGAPGAGISGGNFTLAVHAGTAPEPSSLLLAAVAAAAALKASRRKAPAA